MTITINTIAEATKYWKSHPTRDGGSWNGYCQSYVYRGLYNGANGGKSATTAYLAYVYTKRIGEIYYTNANVQMPIGTVVYFTIPGITEGHVAVVVGANNLLSMASTHTDHRFSAASGYVTLAAYIKATGAHFLGGGSMMGTNFSGAIIDPKKIAAIKKAAADKVAQATAAAAAQKAKQEAADKLAAQKKATDLTAKALKALNGTKPFYKESDSPAIYLIKNHNTLIWVNHDDYTQMRKRGLGLNKELPGGYLKAAGFVNIEKE